MKKNKTLTIKTILSFAAATLFLACSNLGGGSVSNGAGGPNAAGGQGGAQAPVMVTVNGSLAFGGAYPEQIAALVENSLAALQSAGQDGIARSAFPDAVSSGLTYSVYALEELPAGSTDTPLRYEGTVAVDKKSYTVGIPVLTEKKYNVFAEVKNGGITVLSGQSAKVIEAPSGESSFVTDANITLAATQTATGTGLVELTVNVGDIGAASASAVYKVGDEEKTMNGTPSSGGNVMTFKIGEIKTNAGGENYIDGGLKSGAYLMTFNFYSEVDCGGNLLYSFPEVVNVFDGMTTNKWIKNGAEPWLTPDSSGNIACKITAAMVTGFALTDIYVDAATGSDANSGVFWAPKKTLSGDGVNPGALSLLQDANADYTIHITGSLSGAQTIPSTINAKSLTLCGERDPDESGEPYDMINAGGAGTALTIATTVPITIKNFEITGGTGTLINDPGAIDNSIAYGGGIYLSAAGGSLTLGRGAYVTENSADPSSGIYDNKISYGGGICITTPGELNLLDGSVVSANNAKGGGCGGGIAIYKPADSSDGSCNVNIYDGAVIEGNHAYASGTVGGCGGGIFYYTGASVKTTISGGSIRQNIADINGGGICSAGSGSINISGGTIGSNQAKNGGGMYLQKANETREMSGGSISGNKAIDAGFGGGVYLEYGNFKMTGGSISGNTAIGTAGKGGGVYLRNSSASLFMSKKALIGDSGATVAYNDDGSGYSNLAVYGGGIYNNGGGVYIGYKDADNEEEMTSASYGVLHNATYGASGEGGGIYVTGSNAKLKIASGGVSYNFAHENGGAIWASTKVSGSTYYGEIINGTFTGNMAGKNGGVLYLPSQMTFKISNGTFSNNKAASTTSSEPNDCGGGVAFVASGNNSKKSALYISGGTYKSNQVTGKGGCGGAIYLNGSYITLSIGNATFESNKATGNLGYGGAIFSNATDTSIDPPIQIGNGTYIKTSSTPNTNDVYLKNSNTRIKVISFSTGNTETDQVPITLGYSVSSGTTVLTKYDYESSDMFKLFKIISPTGWKIDSGGKLAPN